MSDARLRRLERQVAVDGADMLARVALSREKRRAGKPPTIYILPPWDGKLDMAYSLFPSPVPGPSARIRCIKTRDGWCPMCALFPVRPRNLRRVKWRRKRSKR